MMVVMEELATGPMEDQEVMAVMVEMATGL